MAAIFINIRMTTFPDRIDAIKRAAEAMKKAAAGGGDGQAQCNAHKNVLVPLVNKPAPRA